MNSQVQSPFAVWVGQSVVLQVAQADFQVPLRGIIVGESEEAIRFRIGDSWDVDIYKSMILAVEEEEWTNDIT